jgi:hypothetical protein
VKPRSLFFLLFAATSSLTACTPILQAVGEASDREARKQAIERNAPILKAECYARDGLQRVNRLQQGPNLCLFRALAPLELGEIVRLRFGVAKVYNSKSQPVVEIEDFELSDKVFNGSRIALIYPILMPDSLTGSAVALFTGIGKAVLPRILEAKAQILGIPLNLTNDPNLQRFFDPSGNFNSANERFNNLGERPLSVQVQIRVCSDVCVTSPVLNMQTR